MLPVLEYKFDTATGWGECSTKQLSERDTAKQLKLVCQAFKSSGRPAARFTERSEWKVCVYTESSEIYCIHITVMDLGCVFTSYL